MRGLERSDRSAGPALVGVTMATVLLGSVVLASFATPALAQDNPVPLNYRNLTVKAFEVNNNRNDPMRGVKITIEPQKPDQFVDFPLSGTINGALGTRFSKIPPSSVVGTYTITAESRDCGTQTRRGYSKNGGSDQIHTFTFTRCGQSGVVADEFARRAAGGYDLEVRLKEGGGTRGNGYNVAVFDRNGRKVKQVRSSGRGEANFQDLDPDLAPYRVDVFRFATKVASHDVPTLQRDQLATIDLDAASAGGGSPGSPGGTSSNQKAQLEVRVDTPLTVLLKDSRGRTVAKGSLRGDSVSFPNLDSGRYKVEFYLGRKRLASYDYEMKGSNEKVSYRLDR